MQKNVDNKAFYPEYTGGIRNDTIKLFVECLNKQRDTDKIFQDGYKVTYKVIPKK